LPRHLLEPALSDDSSAEFLASPFWSTQYVGAGPFRLQRWEPGAYMEATAFDGHVGGKPKIDALRIGWINDANTAVSDLLSGEVQLLVDDVIYLEQAVTVRRQMVDQGTGGIVIDPGLWRGTQVQTHPERVAPGARALTDVRVRKALAY